MACFAQEDSSLLDDQRERIVFTGSSSVKMWGTLNEDLAEFPHLILNRGFGGSTLPAVNYYFEQLIVPHEPKAIVLYCGENDITDGQSAEDVFASFRLFMGLWYKHVPEAKVLFISMKPSPARWKLWSEFERGNKLIKDYIQQLNRPEIQYLDVSAAMLTGPQGRPEPTIFIEDSLHMNDLGYDRWEATIYEPLKKLVDFKDEADRQEARTSLDSYLEQYQVESRVMASFHAYLTAMAAANPKVDSTFWTHFQRDRITANQKKINSYLQNQLLDGLIMAEWTILGDACLAEETPEHTAALEKFFTRLDQLTTHLQLDLQESLRQALISPDGPQDPISSDTLPLSAIDWSKRADELASTSSMEKVSDENG